RPAWLRHVLRARPGGRDHDVPHGGVIRRGKPAVLITRFLMSASFPVMEVMDMPEHCRVSRVTRLRLDGRAFEAGNIAIVIWLQTGIATGRPIPRTPWTAGRNRPASPVKIPDRIPKRT